MNTSKIIQVCELALESAVRNCKIGECYRRIESDMPVPQLDIEKIHAAIRGKEYIVGSWLEHSKKSPEEAPWGIMMELESGQFRVFRRGPAAVGVASRFFDDQYQACALVILRTIETITEG